MSEPAATRRYISDGTYSLDDRRETLAAAGTLVGGPDGTTRFVPDDPSFPTTVFRPGGIIEVCLSPADDVDAYIARLSAWLGVALQAVTD